MPSSNILNDCDVFQSGVGGNGQRGGERRQKIKNFAAFVRLYLIFIIYCRYLPSKEMLALMNGIDGILQYQQMHLF